MRRASVAVVFFLSLASAMSAATFDRIITDQALLERADLVLTATVEGASSRAADGAIVTDYRLRVERVLMGTTGSDAVTVTEFGGIAGNLIMAVPGSAAYEPGTRVLAFLRNRGDGNYVTAYMGHGVLRFARENGREMVVRSHDGASTMSLATEVIDFVLGKTTEPARVTALPDGPATNALASSYTTTFDPDGALPRRPVRWDCDGSPVCNINFVLNGAQSGVVDGGSTGVEAALSAWSDAAAYVNLQLTGLTAVNTTQPDDVNAIMLDNNSASPIPCDGALACGIGWGTSATHTFDGETFYSLFDADVLFRPGAHPANTFAAIMAHEIGHGLGLRHSNDADPRTTDAIMHNPTPTGQGATLRQWDLDAMAEVYGAGIACTPAAVTNVSGGGTVPYGSKANLSVTATGSTPRTYQWYEGVKDDTSSPVGTNSTSFQTPNITQEKKYWVKVSNECGNASSNTITVTPAECTAAQIGTQPVSQRIQPGAKATLTVTATGTAPLTYAWYEGERGDTSKKVGSNSNQFQTPALNTTTTYWVRVSNACGQVNSLAAVITVGTQCVPPTISSHPSGGDISLGAKALLQVAAGGDAPITFQWYEGESPDTSKPVDGATAALFEPGPFQSAGTFKYWVRATNSCGSANSNTATLVVVCPAPAVPAMVAPPVAPSVLAYEVSWTGNVAVTPTFEVQESTNPDFIGATTTVVSGALKHLVPSHPSLTADTRFYYRVRGISGCTGVATAYSNTVNTVVTVPLPANSTEFVVGVPEGTTTSFTQDYLVPGFGETATNNDTFSISIDVPWITVFPASGALSAGGTTVQLTIAPAGLGAGSTTGTISVQRTNATSAKFVGTHGSTTTSVPFSISLVTPVSPVPRDTAPPAGTLLIPAIAHADGIGTRFQSDIRIANAASESITYDISFTPTASDGTTAGKKTTMVIASNETRGLDDVVKTWFGAGVLGETGLGTLEIRPIKLASGGAPSPLSTVASSRTYAISSAGTLGQFIPALPLTSFISDVSKDALSRISLQQIAHNDRYRTNIGFTEGSGQNAELLVKLLDATGNVLKSATIALGPYEHRQTGFTGVFGSGSTIADGRIEVEVTSASGKVTAYASVLDSNTTDPLLVYPVQAGRLSASRYVVPGVAELNTASNFHTDMRIFNPSANPVSVSLAYKPQRGDSTPIPAALTRTIGAGQILAIDNVLPTLWNLNTTGGAVTVTTANNAALVATARTYSREADGGTYGQFIPAVTATDAVGLGDRGLEILQLEDSANFRSNVGLVEVTGNPVRVEMTLRTPDAKETGFLHFDLAGGEFLQVNRIFRSAGYANVYNGRVTLKVIEGAGRVAGYGSVVDNRTADPTYVPSQ